MIHIDPTDFTCLLCDITLQNEAGEVRVRILQWNSTGDERLRNVSTTANKEIAEGACEALAYSVEHTPVDKVRWKLGIFEMNISFSFPHPLVLFARDVFYPVEPVPIDSVPVL